MAWQTPKTNWTSSDGVRDSDFNRIEGNALELYNSMALRNSVTVYVSTSGNDSTGIGTSSAPFRTIARALSAIPKNLDGKAATINIAAGTYQESVVIANYTGVIAITGAYGAVVTINSLTVDACSVYYSSISLRVIATGVKVTNNAMLMGNSSITVNESATGILVDRGSRCIINAAVNVSYASAAAIHVNNCSNMYVLQLTVSDSLIVVQVEQGSTFAYGNTNLTVNSITFVTRSGGRINTGAQLNIGS